MEIEISDGGGAPPPAGPRAAAENADDDPRDLNRTALATKDHVSESVDLLVLLAGSCLRQWLAAGKPGAGAADRRCRG